MATGAELQPERAQTRQRAQEVRRLQTHQEHAQACERGRVGRRLRVGFRLHGAVQLAQTAAAGEQIDRLHPGRVAPQRTGWYTRAHAAAAAAAGSALACRTRSSCSGSPASPSAAAATARPAASCSAGSRSSHWVRCCTVGDCGGMCMSTSRDRSSSVESLRPLSERSGGGCSSDDEVARAQCEGGTDAAGAAGAGRMCASWSWLMRWWKAKRPRGRRRGEVQQTHQTSALCISEYSRYSR